MFAAVIVCGVDCILKGGITFCTLGGGTMSCTLGVGISCTLGGGMISCTLGVGVSIAADLVVGSKVIFLLLLIVSASFVE